MKKDTPKLPVSKKFRLRSALVIPFTLQILAAVGIVGYLSFKNGQEAVDYLNTQLQEQAQARIRQRLDSYLATPSQINQINLEAIQLGLLKSQDKTTLGRYFWRQMKTFSEISYINIGTEGGEFIGIGREDDGSLYLELMNAGDAYRYKRYGLNDQGQPTRQLMSQEYQFKEERWYKNAANTRQPLWSEIYQWSDRPEIISISSSYPILDQDQKLVGVLGIDFVLSQVSQFLKTLKIGKSGRVFVIERNGLIVASSSAEPAYLIDSGKAQRLNAIQSQDPLIRSTAAYLKQTFTDLSQIKNNQAIKFDDNQGDRLLARVQPWQDNLGLDWLIVTVVPESDFMGQISENTRNTVFLCLAALVCAVISGMYSSRWITRPVLKLNDAANQIAAGNLDQHVDLNDLFQIIEISYLAESFNSMSSQLKASFEILETQKNSFARFFPPEYLKFLNKSDVTDIELGDHISKEMAVMFSDIRSFTTLSEKMSPQENFDFVNAYLRRVSPEIRSHNGFIVKFLGDGMMAVFPNGVDDALAAGVAKSWQVHRYNEKRQAEGLLPIDVGIGIHVGHMMVGMVGEHNRIQGDAFSDNVNLTARLEGLTKFYGVALLISEDVLTRLSNSNQYKIRFLDRAIVKGRNEPIGVYEVLDAQLPDVCDLKLQTQADFDRGIEAYCAGQLSQARDCFERVLAIHPTDKTGLLYLNRIEILVEQGIPENWTGIWTFSEK